MSPAKRRVGILGFCGIGTTGGCSGWTSTSETERSVDMNPFNISDGLLHQTLKPYAQEVGHSFLAAVPNAVRVFPACYTVPQPV